MRHSRLVRTRFSHPDTPEAHALARDAALKRKRKPIGGYMPVTCAVCNMPFDAAVEVGQMERIEAVLASVASRGAPAKGLTGGRVPLEIASLAKRGDAVLRGLPCPEDMPGRVTLYRGAGETYAVDYTRSDGASVGVEFISATPREEVMQT